LQLIKKLMNERTHSLLWAALIFALLIALGVYFASKPHEMNADVELTLLDKEVGYAQVKPILENRCVVCHGCYDAPCQLRLSSVQGLQRGASQERIYEPKRITTMQPTRLFIDAKTTQQWRARGFTPVLNEGDRGAGNNFFGLSAKTWSGSPTNTQISNLDNSVLYHLLRLKQQHPQPDQDKLPATFTFDLNREESCPTLDTFDDYAKKTPLWGMPYGMPNLSEPEYHTLVSWIAQGISEPPVLQPSPAVLPQIDNWEEFLNQPSNKQRLVSRYLYEHLFHAHIHFANSPDREFYRLVRSVTPPGEPIDEIATVRPYDDPGTPVFYYRLLRYQPSIVVKSHIVYEFSDQRMARYQALFFSADYKVDKLPPYQTEVASNPFKTFSALPADSRYRFMLDDAYFFIQGFIKGPVCRGQIALDVIEDQFWVLFFDPDQSLITNDEQFIDEMTDELQVPADGGSNLDLLRIWTDYWKGQRRYMEKKQAWFKTIGTHDIDHAMGFIWDGDGHNPNAALTVFRHFDSGSVAYGLVGKDPETTWVIDYPLFERIHYLLVAGFNVFGNLGHRMSTRIYMDFLRMEGEDYFLAFLPANQRKKIRDSWYVGQRRTIDELFSAPQEWLSTEAVSGYQTLDPQKELYSSIRKRLAAILPKSAHLNLCGQTRCQQAILQDPSIMEFQRVARAMQQIAQLNGENLHAFPDVAFVHIETENPEDDFAYTLIRNKAYKNVTSFLADEHERDRADIEKDSMTVVKWLEGSYPNFFFSVKLSEIEDFARRCSAINSHDDYENFVNRYGVRRTSPEFWKLADWFQEAAARNKPVSSGLFDLSRYVNY